MSQTPVLYPYLPDYVTSATKLEIHNILHCCQRTKPKLQATCIENTVKFGRVVFETDRQTDRQTYRDRHYDHNTSHPPKGQSNKTAN